MLHMGASTPLILLLLNISVDVMPILTNHYLSFSSFILVRMVGDPRNTGHEVETHLNGMPVHPCFWEVGGCGYREKSMQNPS